MAVKWLVEWNVPAEEHELDLMRLSTIEMSPSSKDHLRKPLHHVTHHSERICVLQLVALVQKTTRTIFVRKEYRDLIGFMSWSFTGKEMLLKKQLSDSELMKVDVEVQEVARVMKTRLWCSSMQNLPYRIHTALKVLLTWQIRGYIQSARGQKRMHCIITHHITYHILVAKL